MQYWLHILHDLWLVCWGEFTHLSAFLLHIAVMKMDCFIYRQDTCRLVQLWIKSDEIWKSLFPRQPYYKSMLVLLLRYTRQMLNTSDVNAYLGSWRRRLHVQARSISMSLSMIMMSTSGLCCNMALFSPSCLGLSKHFSCSFMFTFPLTFSPDCLNVRRALKFTVGWITSCHILFFGA